MAPARSTIPQTLRMDGVLQPDPRFRVSCADDVNIHHAANASDRRTSDLFVVFKSCIPLLKTTRAEVEASIGTNTDTTKRGNRIAKTLPSNPSTPPLEAFHEVYLRNPAPGAEVDVRVVVNIHVMLSC